MNKEKYIKKVIRLLNCSQQQKKKIKLDLENDIEMALKNGESFEEVIQRMGTPKELAHESNENMGVKTRRSYKKIIGIIMGVVAVLILGVYLLVRSLIPEYQTLGTSGLFDQKTVEQHMEETILDVSHLDIQAILENCDEKMKESMSESLLKESILSLGDLGDYQRITSQRYTEVKQNNDICVVGEVAALYEQRSVAYTITFNENYELMGLYLK